MQLMDTSAEQKKRELVLFQKFLLSLQDKAEELRSRSDSVPFRLTPAERSKLNALNNIGYWQGALAGIFAFGVLRRGPVLLTNYLTKRFLKEGSSSASSPRPRSPFRPQQQSNTGFPAYLRNESRFVYYPWLLFDFCLSAATGIAVSSSYIDSSDLLEDVSQLPLAEGKSRFSQEFCPVAIASYEKLTQADPDSAWAPQTPYLQAARKFTMNCRRRQAYEQKIRFSNAMQDNELVDVPSPGVPMTLDTNEQEIDHFNSDGATGFGMGVGADHDKW